MHFLLTGRRALPVITLLVGVLALLVVGFLPLFGTPGYEFALGTGLVLPPVCASHGALLAAGRSCSPSQSLQKALGIGALLLGAALIISLLHGFVGTLCAPQEGLWLVFLGGGFGALIASAWGAAAGCLVRDVRRFRRVLAVALGLAGPLGGILLSLWRFYDSPMVFAFDPFFGYFAGPLYETVIDPYARLLSYRVGSAASLTALWVALHQLEATPPKATLSSLLRRPAAAALGLGALALSAGIHLSGERLHHRSSESGIRERLSLSKSHGPCQLWHAPETPGEQVRLLAKECAAHVGELALALALPTPSAVRVYVFPSAAEKGLLMGATRTLIAKPWRGEIYLTPQGFPHPVLRHELVHVLSAAAGRGPFKIAGPLGGLIPDPGRIEGLAEAAAPDEDSDVRLLEWAAAMLHHGRLPALDSVFRLTFFGRSATSSYTVAGAFIHWLAEHYGMPAVLSWYGGAELAAVSGGKPLDQLEKEFHESLRQIAIEPRVLAAAEARFAEPSVFGRVCPHAVDQAYAEGAIRLASQNLPEAKAAFLRVLSLDPSHFEARMSLARTLYEAGHADEAGAQYLALSKDAKRSQPERDRALQQLADHWLSSGRFSEARRAYQRLLDNTVNEHLRRTLEVKRFATTASDPAKEAILRLLIGDAQRRPSWDSAGPRLGYWKASDPSAGLPSYLLGRHLYNSAEYREAADELERALNRELPLDSVRREAARLLLLTSCAVGRRPMPPRFKSLLSDPGFSKARRDGILAQARRCKMK